MCAISLTNCSHFSKLSESNSLLQSDIWQVKLFSVGIKRPGRVYSFVLSLQLTLLSQNVLDVFSFCFLQLSQTKSHVFGTWEALLCISTASDMPTTWVTLNPCCAMINVTAGHAEGSVDRS